MNGDFKDFMLVLGWFGFLGAPGLIASALLGEINISCIGFLAVSAIAFYIAIK